MTVPQTEPKVVADVRSLLNQNAGQIAKLLPRSIPSDRFLAIILTTFQEDEKLQACSIASFAKCVLQCAQFGFLPGPRRQVYFVPYWNSKKRCHEVQLIPGYQGLLTLARNSGKITNVIAEAVYDGDEFTFTLGLNPTIVHVPKSPWREEPDARKAFEHMTHVYAIAKLKDGDPQFVVISKKRIDGHRDRFSKAKDDKGNPTGPWRDHPIEQSLKTALRELCNLLPSADEDVRGGGLSTAVTIDKQAEANVPQTLEPFTIEGLATPVDDPKAAPAAQTADQPQHAAGTGDALVLGNFGPCANRRIDDPTVTIQHLEWYQTVINKNMKNKARTQFKDSDRRELIAIEKELERRKAAKPDEKPASDAAAGSEGQAGPKTGEGQDAARSAEPDGKKAEGTDVPDLPPPADFTEWSIRAQEKYRDLYYKVKDDLSCKAGDPIPVAKRSVFYSTFNFELTKAGKDQLL